MNVLNEQTHDLEAIALARCYRLLLQKAAERRARLQQDGSAVSDDKQPIAIENKPILRSSSSTVDNSS